MGRLVVGVCVAAALLATLCLFAGVHLTSNGNQQQQLHQDKTSAHLQQEVAVMENLQELEQMLTPHWGQQKDVLTLDRNGDKSAVRKLQAATSARDHTTLTSPMIIPLGNGQVAANRNTYQMHSAYSYIFQNIRPTSSELVAYPFPFMHRSPGEPLNATRRIDGAVFRTKGVVSNAYFKYLAAEKVDIGEAKALYDASIAILKVETADNGRLRDLTFESGYFCDALYSYLMPKYDACFVDTPSYLKYMQDPSHKPTAIVYLNVTDVQKDFLREYVNTTGETRNRFGVLILPDIVLGTAGNVVSQLGVEGAAAIKRFVQAGGTVYSSGKAALVLEKLGLLNEGTVDTTRLLSANGNSVYLDGEGCFNKNDEAAALAGDHHKPSSVQGGGANFYQKMACLGLVKNSETDPHADAAQYLLSSYPLKPAADTQMSVLLKFDPSASPLNYKDAQTGVQTPIANGSAPLAGFARKTIGQGQLLINLAQPVVRSDLFFPLFYSSLLMAFSQNVIVNYYAEHKVKSEFVSADAFPALEADIALTSTYETVNLFSEDTTNLKLDVWVAKGFDVVSVPAGCVLKPNVTRTLNTVIMNQYYVCKQDKLRAFSNITYNFKLMIVEATATQRGSNVPVTYATLSYTELTGKPFTHEIGYTYIQAYPAAVLRADYNIDPSSFYPLPGEGVEVDPVLTCMNKERTSAFKVEHISIVPLISPLVDGDRQDQLVETVSFFEGYYKQSTNGVKEYNYPFVKDINDYDFVDYKLLSKSKAQLVAEWDIPVRATKMERSSSVAPFPQVYNASGIDSVGNAQYNKDISTSNEVLKQAYFARMDQLYEHAVPRLMPFLDTANLEVAAAAKYPSGIPASLLNNRLAALGKKVTKKEFVFSRSDIFFELADVLPEGIQNRSTVITVDAYANPACTWGGRVQKIKPGYFSSKIGGLKEDEFSNGILADCMKQKVAFKDIETFTKGKVKKTSYLMPIKTPGIEEATDIMHLNPDGTHEQYPDVRFVKVWYGQFFVAPETSRNGGYWEFTLPAGLSFNSDPIANELIVYAVNHVALRYSTYDAKTRTVRSYFQRGNMPNERYGRPSEMEVVFKDVSWTGAAPANFSIDIKIYSLSFTFSDDGSDSFEVYTPSATLKQVAITKKPFFSLPAVLFRFPLNTNDQGELKGYQNLQPFVRHGLYYQEMLAHRTLWGSAESHHVRNPGMQTGAVGFAVVSTVGISSIPFKEYVTTGSTQVIPFASSNARVEWRDLWGRLFSQPVRSTFADVPPIPPPLRNFMMTSTFELLNPVTGERMDYWPSDRPVDVHVHIKLLNNYPKYFEPTTCKANELLRNVAVGPITIYDGSASYVPQPGNASFPRNEQLIAQSHNAKYGACWWSQGTRMGGQTLTAAQLAQVKDLSLCELDIDDCPHYDGLPTLHTRPATDKSAGLYSYSPDVESYWPNGYISQPMWDFTHYDYSDSAYAKGYPYHMDNRLPSIDNIVKKPHNIISVPIWKGLGFKVLYDPTYANPAMPNKTGWWSDQLQNKDDTILSGSNNPSNKVSVDKEDVLYKQNAWVPIEKLWGPNAQKASKSALTNLYTCLFNRHRLRIDPDQKKYAFTGNAYINNIVPIPPNIQNSDLVNFQCDLSQPQYFPSNISLFDNRLETNSARDWLYFGANLRGGAKENLHVIMHLEPFSDVLYEQVASKVYDGGRFVYWNPANGPNSFLVVDNIAHVVQAKRTDLTTTNRPIPFQVPTANPTFFHIVLVEDAAEKAREFRESSWADMKGFGDSTVHVYVGEVGSSARVWPGQNTLVKIQIMNNAGFDWRMYKGAMESPLVDQSSLAANGILSTVQNSWQQVTKYNFLKFTVPDALKPYVTITPSTHMNDVEPIFFDLENINTATIRDGFESNYYINITLASSVPDSLRGVLHQIKVELVESYFESLPGVRDPTKTGFHNYKLQIPNIVFGIPLSENSQYPGRIFYNLGFAEDIFLSMKLAADTNIESVKLATLNDVNQMSWLSGQVSSRESLLNNYYNNIKSTPVAYTLSPKQKTLAGESWRQVSFNFSRLGYPTLPLPRPQEPADHQVYLIVRCNATSFPYGTQKVATDLSVDYEDFTGQHKSDKDSVESYNVFAKGASIQALLNLSVVAPGSHARMPKQRFLPNTTNNVMVTASVTNTGSAVAYNLELLLTVAPDMSVLLSELTQKYTASGRNATTKYGADKKPVSIYSGNAPLELRLKTGTDLAPGDVFVTSVLLEYRAPATEQLSKLVVDDSYVQFEQTIKLGEHIVYERFSSLKALEMGVYDMLAGNITATVGKNRAVHLVAKTNVKNIQYGFIRRDGFLWTHVATTDANTFTDRPDGGDYVYRVQFMQQDDPSKAPLLLGQSGTVTVHVDTLTDLQEVLLSMVLLGVACGILFVALLAYGGYIGKKKYDDHVDTYKGVVAPVTTDPVDLEVAKQVNRRHRLYNEKPDLQRVDDREYFSQFEQANVHVEPESASSKNMVVKLRDGVVMTLPDFLRQPQIHLKLTPTLIQERLNAMARVPHGQCLKLSDFGPAPRISMSVLGKPKQQWSQDGTRAVPALPATLPEYQHLGDE